MYVEINRRLNFEGCEISRINTYKHKEIIASDEDSYATLLRPFEGRYSIRLLNYPLQMEI